jgi:hypothetical protein
MTIPIESAASSESAAGPSSESAAGPSSESAAGPSSESATGPNSASHEASRPIPSPRDAAPAWLSE